MSEINKNCMPINEVKSTFFTYSDLKKVTNTSLFEKIALIFVKKQYQIDKTEGNTLVYKLFRGRLYILHHYMHPPNGWNCRCFVQPL